MISDERLKELEAEDDLYNYPPTLEELNGMAKELLALRKLINTPIHLPQIEEARWINHSGRFRDEAYYLELRRIILNAGLKVNE